MSQKSTDLGQCENTIFTNVGYGPDEEYRCHNQAAREVVIPAGPFSPEYRVRVCRDCDTTPTLVPFES